MIYNPTRMDFGSSRYNIPKHSLIGQKWNVVDTHELVLYPANTSFQFYPRHQEPHVFHGVGVSKAAKAIANDTVRNLSKANIQLHQDNLNVSGSGGGGGDSNAMLYSNRAKSVISAVSNVRSRAVSMVKSGITNVTGKASNALRRAASFVSQQPSNESDNENNVSMDDPDDTSSVMTTKTTKTKTAISFIGSRVSKAKSLLKSASGVVKGMFQTNDEQRSESESDDDSETNDVARLNDLVSEEVGDTSPLGDALLNHNNNPEDSEMTSNSAFTRENLSAFNNNMSNTLTNAIRSLGSRTMSVFSSTSKQNKELPRSSASGVSLTSNANKEADYESQDWKRRQSLLRSSSTKSLGQKPMNEGDQGLKTSLKGKSRVIHEQKQEGNIDDDHDDDDASSSSSVVTSIVNLVSKFWSGGGGSDVGGGKKGSRINPNTPNKMNVDDSKSETSSASVTRSQSSVKNLAPALVMKGPGSIKSVGSQKSVTIRKTDDIVVKKPLRNDDIDKIQNIVADIRGTNTTANKIQQFAVPKFSSTKSKVLPAAMTDTVPESNQGLQTIQTNEPAAAHVAISETDVKLLLSLKQCLLQIRMCVRSRTNLMNNLVYFGNLFGSMVIDSEVLKQTLHTPFVRRVNYFAKMAIPLYYPDDHYHNNPSHFNKVFNACNLELLRARSLQKTIEEACNIFEKTYQWKRDVRNDEPFDSKSFMQEIEVMTRNCLELFADATAQQIEHIVASIIAMDTLNDCIDKHVFMPTSDHLINMQARDQENEKNAQNANKNDTSFLMDSKITMKRFILFRMLTQDYKKLVYEYVPELWKSSMAAHGQQLKTAKEFINTARSEKSDQKMKLLNNIANVFKTLEIKCFESLTTPIVESFEYFATKVSSFDSNMYLRAGSHAAPAAHLVVASQTYYVSSGIEDLTEIAVLELFQLEKLKLSHALSMSQQKTQFQTLLQTLGLGSEMTSHHISAAYIGNKKIAALLKSIQPIFENIPQNELTMSRDNRIVDSTTLLYTKLCHWIFFIQTYLNELEHRGPSSDHHVNIQRVHGVFNNYRLPYDTETTNVPFSNRNPFNVGFQLHCFMSQPSIKTKILSVIPQYETKFNLFQWHVANNPSEIDEIADCDKLFHTCIEITPCLSSVAQFTHYFSFNAGENKNITKMKNDVRFAMRRNMGIALNWSIENQQKQSNVNLFNNQDVYQYASLSRVVKLMLKFDQMSHEKDDKQPLRIIGSTFDLFLRINVPFFHHSHAYMIAADAINQTSHVVEYMNSLNRDVMSSLSFACIEKIDIENMHTKRQDYTDVVTAIMFTNVNDDVKTGGGKDKQVEVVTGVQQLASSLYHLKQDTLINMASNYCSLLSEQVQKDIKVGLQMFGFCYFLKLTLDAWFVWNIAHQMNAKPINNNNNNNITAIGQQQKPNWCLNDLYSLASVPLSAFKLCLLQQPNFKDRKPRMECQKMIHSTISLMQIESIITSDDVQSYLNYGFTWICEYLIAMTLIPILPKSVVSNIDVSYTVTCSWTMEILENNINTREYFNSIVKEKAHKMGIIDQSLWVSHFLNNGNMFMKLEPFLQLIKETHKQCKTSLMAEMLHMAQAMDYLMYKFLHNRETKNQINDHVDGNLKTMFIHAFCLWLHIGKCLILHSKNQQAGKSVQADVEKYTNTIVAVTERILSKFLKDFNFESDDSNIQHAKPKCLESMFEVYSLMNGKSHKINSSVRKKITDFVKNATQVRDDASIDDSIAAYMQVHNYEIRLASSKNEVDIIDERFLKVIDEFEKKRQQLFVDFKGKKAVYENWFSATEIIAMTPDSFSLLSVDDKTIIVKKWIENMNDMSGSDAMSNLMLKNLSDSQSQWQLLMDMDALVYLRNRKSLIRSSFKNRHRFDFIPHGDNNNNDNDDHDFLKSPKQFCESVRTSIMLDCVFISQQTGKTFSDDGKLQQNEAVCFADAFLENMKHYFNNLSLFPIVVSPFINVNRAITNNFLFDNIVRRYNTEKSNTLLNGTNTKSMSLWLGMRLTWFQCELLKKMHSKGVTVNSKDGRLSFAATTIDIQDTFEENSGRPIKGKMNYATVMLVNPADNELLFPNDVRYRGKVLKNGVYQHAISKPSKGITLRESIPDGHMVHASLVDNEFVTLNSLVGDYADISTTINAIPLTADNIISYLTAYFHEGSTNWFDHCNSVDDVLIHKSMWRFCVHFLHLTISLYAYHVVRHASDYDKQYIRIVNRMFDGFTDSIISCSKSEVLFANLDIDARFGALKLMIARHIGVKIAMMLYCVRKHEVADTMLILEEAKRLAKSLLETLVIQKYKIADIYADNYLRHLCNLDGLFEAAIDLALMSTTWKRYDLDSNVVYEFPPFAQVYPLVSTTLQHAVVMCDSGATNSNLRTFVLNYNGMQKVDNTEDLNNVSDCYMIAETIFQSFVCNYLIIEVAMEEVNSNGQFNYE